MAAEAKLCSDSAADKLLTGLVTLGQNISKYYQDGFELL